MMRAVWCSVMDGCMSMTDPQHTNPVWTGRLAQWRTSMLTRCRDAGAWCVALIKGPSNTLPLVPSENIAGRALVTVIAIMTFLAALTAVSAQMIASAATDWQTSVATEMTIQVRPTPPLLGLGLGLQLELGLGCSDHPGAVHASAVMVRVRVTIRVCGVGGEPVYCYG